MLKKIKDIYKDKCIIDEMPQYPNDYFWFQTEDHHLIGISKNINTAEKRLLAVMFDEIIAVDFDHQTRLLWLDILKGNAVALEKVSQKSLKFIFFNHQFEAEAKSDFEALAKEFSENWLVLYLDRHYGVILDFKNDIEAEELEAFVDASRQDFYYALTFYETDVYELNEEISGAFQTELELFKTCKNPSTLVMRRQDLLFESLCLKVANDARYAAFRKKIADLSPDSLEAVTAYFENNFNLSLAAKGLHMHRNTFMNKLDKFIAVTGLNIKNFPEAVIAYLLIAR